MYTKMLNILTSDLWPRELFLKIQRCTSKRRNAQSFVNKTYFDEALKRKIPSAVQNPREKKTFPLRNITPYTAKQ